jgi:hypothetical protein
LHKPDSTSANPKRDKPSARTRDHEHVGRISTQTTIFVLIAIALVLYEINSAAFRHRRAPGLCQVTLALLCDEPIKEMLGSK